MNQSSLFLVREETIFLLPILEDRIIIIYVLSLTHIALYGVTNKTTDWMWRRGRKQKKANVFCLINWVDSDVKHSTSEKAAEEEG